jgi:hypothetical protein
VRDLPRLVPAPFVLRLALARFFGFALELAGRLFLFLSPANPVSVKSCTPRWLPTTTASRVGETSTDWTATMLLSLSDTVHSARRFWRSSALSQALPPSSISSAEPPELELHRRAFDDGDEVVGVDHHPNKRGTIIAPHRADVFPEASGLEKNLFEMSRDKAVRWELSTNDEVAL